MFRESNYTCGPKCGEVQTRWGAGILPAFDLPSMSANSIADRFAKPTGGNPWSL